MFNELVDFVEIEQAWHHCMWSDDAKTKFDVPWWRKGWLRWRTWRCPEAGMEYLRWASGLTVGEDMGAKPDSKGYGEPTHQAKAAREIIELYTWWTTVYPDRKDPMDLSGWSTYCEESRAANGGSIWGIINKTPARQKESRRLLKLCNKIEQEQNDEDTAMLKRLIDVRHSLWT